MMVWHDTGLQRKSRKMQICQQWASSEAANKMSIFELGRWLIDLDDAETPEEIERLETRWLEFNKNPSR
jgi:hypothetical protein